MKKKSLALAFVAVLATGLFGCGKGNDWVFSLHGEKLYDTEVRTFGVIYASEHNITNSSQLQEIYEGRETYEDYYKEEFSQDLTETIVLYAEAKKEGVKLSKEEKQEVEDKAQTLAENVGDTWMEVKNLTVEDLQDAYEKKALGEAYLEQQADTSDQKDTDSEQQSDASDQKDTDSKQQSDTSSQEENGSGQRYIKVYEVSFPTVQLDENGMVVSNQEGELETISTAEKEEKRQQAEEFSEKAKDGEDMESLLKDYDATITGVERVLKYEDLDSAYKKAVDALGKNEISGVIETSYGYCVVKMLEEDDTEHGEKLDNYEAETAVGEKKDEALEKLLDTYAKDETEYRNEELWEEISFSGFLR
jgi:foldase protein PrsA